MSKRDFIEDVIPTIASGILAQLDYPLPPQWDKKRKSFLWWYGRRVSREENKESGYRYEIEPTFSSPSGWTLIIHTMSDMDNIHIDFDIELSVEENVDLYLMRKL